MTISDRHHTPGPSVTPRRSLRHPSPGAGCRPPRSRRSSAAAAGALLLISVLPPVDAVAKGAVVHVNEIQLTGLDAGTGDYLTAFYLWTKPQLIAFPGSRPQPARILHPPVTVHVRPDGTATIPAVGIGVKGLKPTLVRVVRHEQPEVFLRKRGLESLPGDPRTVGGRRLRETDFASARTWDFVLRNHPELTAVPSDSATRATTRTPSWAAVYVPSSF